jgi:hypothetical protein
VDSDHPSLVEDCLSRAAAFILLSFEVRAAKESDGIRVRYFPLHERFVHSQSVRKHLAAETEYEVNIAKGHHDIVEGLVCASYWRMFGCCENGWLN